MVATLWYGNVGILRMPGIIGKGNVIVFEYRLDVLFEGFGFVDYILLCFESQDQSFCFKEEDM